MSVEQAHGTASSERGAKRARAQQYWSTAASQRLVELPHGRVIHDADGIVKAREDIEDEEYAVRSVLASVLARKNAFLPIHKLPSEVLALVFQHLSYDRNVGWRPTRSYLSDKDRRSLIRDRVLRLGWVVATHVCQRWRQVALDNPSLWGHLSFDLGLRVAEEMLARAKSAPIYVDMVKIPWSTRYLTDAPEFVSEHISHTKYLRITHRIAFKSLTSTLTRPAPILEALKLVGGMGRDGGDALPPVLFAGHAPKLRRLELIGVFCLWTSIPTGNLRHLNIQFQEPVNGPHISFPSSSHNDLIDFLGACPALQTLNLGDCLPPRPSPAANRRTAKLLHLTTLSLSGSTDRVSNILEHLNIPPTTTLSLVCVSDNPEDDSAVLPLISHHFNAFPSSASFCTLAMVAAPNLTLEPRSVRPSLSVHAWRTCYAEPEGAAFVLSGEDGDISPDFFITLRGHYPPEMRLARLKRLCDALPLADLNYLSVGIKYTPWMTARHWIQVFGAYAGVRSLQVSAAEACGFHDALLETLDEGSDQHDGDAIGSSPGRLLFPQLKSLFLRSTDLVCRPKGADDKDAPDVLDWAASLKQRGERGAPLEHLGIEACRIFAEEVDLLKDEDYNVEWDGVEHGSDEESDENRDRADDNPGDDDGDSEGEDGIDGGQVI